MMEAKDAAAAGCCVVSTMRVNTSSTSVEWSLYTCSNIFAILVGSLIFCHLQHQTGIETQAIISEASLFLLDSFL